MREVEEELDLEVEPVTPDSIIGEPTMAEQEAPSLCNADRYSGMEYTPDMVAFLTIVGITIST